MHDAGHADTHARHARHADIHTDTYTRDISSNFENLTKIWLKNSRSRHFAGQIPFFSFCAPFKTKVMPIQNRDFFYGTNSWSVNFRAEYR